MTKLFATNTELSHLNIGTLPRFNPALPDDFFKAPISTPCEIDGTAHYLHIDNNMALLSKDWKPKLSQARHSQDLRKYDACYLYTALHRVCSYICGDLVLTNLRTGAQAAVTLDCWLGS